MRKSVLFFIGIIYIVSIVVVTFFGMRAKMDQFQIYVSNISITSFDQEFEGMKYLTVNFNDTEGYASVFITYNYAPEDATFPDRVRFSLVDNTYVDAGGETHYYAEISATGELVFYARKAVKVTITTADGSKLSDSVTVICR